MVLGVESITKYRVQLERCQAKVGFPAPNAYADERDEEQSQLTRKHVDEPHTRAE